MAYDTSFTGQKFKVIGTRPLRPDGIDKVTGRARYGADASAPGQLVGRVLRSPHAHARITKIDTSKAEKLPGVKAVITSADLPDLTNGDRGMYDILVNCMAREKVLYDGHAVAAVAAIDATTARKALKLINVDYEILPHVTDVDEAMKPSAPVLHSDMFTEGVEPAFSRIEVADSQGKALAAGGLEHPDAPTLRVSLPALASGRYQVRWKVVSEDTHETQGTFEFSVAAP